MFKTSGNGCQRVGAVSVLKTPVTGMLLRGPGRLGPSGQKQGSLGTCGGVLGFGWSTTPEVLFGGNTHVDKMPFPIESANTSSLGVTLYRSIYFLTVSTYLCDSLAGDVRSEGIGVGLPQTPAKST